MQLAMAHDMRWTKGLVENRIILTLKGQYITEMDLEPNYTETTEQLSKRLWK